MLPRRFCENTSCFDSAVGTVEATLPYLSGKPLPPLPHYLLLVIWYLLECWHHAACWVGVQVVVLRSADSGEWSLGGATRIPMLMWMRASGWPQLHPSACLPPLGSSCFVILQQTDWEEVSSLELM